MIDAERGIESLKAMVEAFPGVLIGLKRQQGKTTAIMEMVHESHWQFCCIFSPHRNLSQITRERYREKYPNDKKAVFVSSIDELAGRKYPIYVDEWWMLDGETQSKLLATGRVVCRFGTEM